jgi:ribonuclease HII
VFPHDVRAELLQARSADKEASDHPLARVRDSKELTGRIRSVLAVEIRRRARAVGVGVVPQTVIDAYGISKANHLAMCLAVLNLGIEPDFLVIDCFSLSNLDTPQEGIIRGDKMCLSIAAASIVAKVERDNIMVALDARYPRYGFRDHKGYGTEKHILALADYGPCPWHRLSFRPIRPES